MSIWHIYGGNRLTGSTQVQGAKNAVLPIMAASVLAGSETVLHNVPDLKDVTITLRILRHSGMRSRPVSVEFVVLDLTRVLVIAGQGASELEEAQRRFDAAGRQRVTYNTSAQDPDRPSAVLFCEGTGTDSGRLVRVYLQPYPQLMDCLRRLCPGKVFVDEL